jgi:hypothetical protein
MRTRRALAVAALVVASLAGSARALPQEAEVEAVAREVTALFRSARAVLSAQQELINDPAKGDKGLSGAKVVELTRASYRELTGADLAEPDDSLRGAAQLALLGAIERVMTQAQPLINEPGKGFKGFLPAVFARAVAEDFGVTMQGRMRIKLTAPKDIVRNRRNRPDEWESGVFEQRFRSGEWKKGEGWSERVAVDGRPAFRLMLPEYYQASCLACHGEPKGELDVTGGKKEGLRLGDLGGAVSVVVFDAPEGR